MNPPAAVTVPACRPPSPVPTVNAAVVPANVP